MKFFEDIRVGETSEIGSHTFTAEDIRTFAERFDPQPAHPGIEPNIAQSRISAKPSSQKSD